MKIEEKLFQSEYFNNSANGYSMRLKLCKSISSVNIKNVMLCELLKDYPLKAQDIKRRDILSPFTKIFQYKSV